MTNNNNVTFHDFRGKPLRTGFGNACNNLHNSLSSTPSDAELEDKPLKGVVGRALSSVSNAFTSTPPTEDELLAQPMKSGFGNMCSSLHGSMLSVYQSVFGGSEDDIEKKSEENYLKGALIH